MPPPGTPRPDAGDLSELHPRARDDGRRAATANPNPGRRTFPRLNRAEYARAVKELLEHRRRRRQVAAARHDERELRQHRRRAGAVADAARGVSQRRRRHQPHGGRRQERAGDRSHLHQPELRVAASVGSRRRRAVRHARRHGRRSRVPGRRRVRLRGDVHRRRQRALRGHRHLDRRRARGAAGVRERPAGRAPTAAARRRS